jgi:DNA-binding beta-propeller fold protein YncE
VEFDPVSVAVDSAGSIYVANTVNRVVLKIEPGGALSIVAGTGDSGVPRPGAAAASPLGHPIGVAVDSAGSVYISAWENHVGEKVDASGQLSIVAGTGDPGAPKPGPATDSPLKSPYGVAVDSAGDLYIADADNSMVEKVSPIGALTVVAGSGASRTPVAGPATASPLANPFGVAVDAAGNLYIADRYSFVVERVDPIGNLSVVAGNGDTGTPVAGPATASPLWSPWGVAVDAAGNLYIAAEYLYTVEKVDIAGNLTVVAGNGKYGTPKPGPATASPLKSPSGVAVDSAGNLYIADWQNHVVEKVDTNGQLSIVAK